jgi:hypothetical protein
LWLDIFWLDPTGARTYRSQDVHANQYTTDAVQTLYYKVCHWLPASFGLRHNQNILLVFVASPHTALISKSRHWLDRNKNNVSKWSSMFTRRMLFQWVSITEKNQLSVMLYEWMIAVNTKWATIVQLYHSEYTLHFNEMVMMMAFAL